MNGFQTVFQSKTFPTREIILKMSVYPSVRIIIAIRLVNDPNIRNCSLELFIILYYPLSTIVPQPVRENHKL